MSQSIKCVHCGKPWKKKAGFRMEVMWQKRGKKLVKMWFHGVCRVVWRCYESEALEYQYEKLPVNLSQAKRILLELRVS